jgi:hypothetical protein
MILLRPDCLVFKMPEGDNVPCSAEEVTLELLGEAVDKLDQETVQHAAHAVLHYFRVELERQVVTIGEFAETLAKVLRDLGLQVETDSVPAPTIPRRVVDADLRHLARETGRGLELAFFNKLRQELRGHLVSGPHVLQFHGLRGCVKAIMGAPRWNNRCQQLNDQIVNYLRACLSAEPAASNCALVVR